MIPLITCLKYSSDDTIHAVIISGVDEKKHADPVKEMIGLINSMIILSTQPIEFHFITNSEGQTKLEEFSKSIERTRIPIEWRVYVLNETWVEEQAKFVGFNHNNHHSGIWGAAKIFVPWLLPDLDRVLLLDTDMIFTKDPGLLWSFFSDTPYKNVLIDSSALIENNNEGGGSPSTKGKRQRRLNLRNSNRNSNNHHLNNNNINNNKNDNNGIVPSISNVITTERRLADYDLQKLYDNKNWYWRMHLNKNHKKHICSCVILVRSSAIRSHPENVYSMFKTILGKTPVNSVTDGNTPNNDADVFFAVLQEKPELFSSLPQEWNIDNCHNYYNVLKAGFDPNRSRSKKQSVGVLHRNCINGDIHAANDEVSPFFDFFTKYPSIWHDGIYHLICQVTPFSIPHLDGEYQ